jgi:hypothetical protein
MQALLALGVASDLYSEPSILALTDKVSGLKGARISSRQCDVQSASQYGEFFNWQYKLSICETRQTLRLDCTTSAFRCAGSLRGKPCVVTFPKQTNFLNGTSMQLAPLELS